MPFSSKAFLRREKGAAADDELLAGLRHHLHAQLDRVIAELLDALHLQGLDDVVADLGVGREVLADLLDQLLRLVDVRVVGDADRHLVHDQVAAHVLHRAELPEGHGVDRPAVVPELDRAQAEALDRSLVAAALDVLADPEGVVEEIEDAADDVAHERLRAEADRDARDARPGDQRPDFHAERRERHHHRDHGERDERDVAEDRQEGAKPRFARCFLALERGRALRRREPAVDQRLQDLPEKVRHEQDDDAAEGAAHEPGHERVAPGELEKVDLPEAREEERRGEDQERAQAALDIDRDEARAPRRAQIVVRGPQQMRGRAVHDRERDGKHERDDREPEKAPQPEHPKNQISTR